MATPSTSKSSARGGAKTTQQAATKQAQEEQVKTEAVAQADAKVEAQEQPAVEATPEVAEKQELPLPSYAPEALAKVFGITAVVGTTITNSLSAFCLAMHKPKTTADYATAARTFGVLVHTSEALNDADFADFYKKLTKYIKDDKAAGGVFTNPAIASALSGNKDAITFYKMLVRLEPSADRAKVVANTNFGAGCAYFNGEVSRRRFPAIWTAH